MPAYDTLYGITNFSDYDLCQLVAGSYITFFDWGLINVGAFTNVYKNNLNINNANLSTLRLSNNPAYLTGQAWETFNNNLVWESGVAISTQPIAISGVYVNNTFYPKNTTGPYKHNIEYTTGRVVFDTPIATTSQVSMEYSFKTVSVIEAKNYPALREIQFRSFDPFNNNFTQLASGDYAKSPNARIRLPLIGVEVTPKIDSVPWELGNKIKRMDMTVIFHVLAEDDNIARKLLSMISIQKESTIFLLDMGLMAQSGAFPLNSRGMLNSNPMTYPNLVFPGMYQFAKTYMIQADGTDGKWVSNNLYHGYVRAITETIY